MNNDKFVYLKCSNEDYHALIYCIDLYKKELERRSKRIKVNTAIPYKPKHQIPVVERIIFEEETIVVNE